jgi:hypothetical protein
MFPEHPEEQRGAAAMQPAAKNEMVRLGNLPRLIEAECSSRLYGLPLHST